MTAIASYGVSLAPRPKVEFFDWVQARGVTRLRLSWAERAFDRSSGGPNKGRALGLVRENFNPSCSECLLA
jgi:hypothetical protein